MSIFHLKWPHYKHEENSLRGIRKAKRRGFSAIDLDMLITSDNRIVGCHWPRPMARDGFYDPKRRLSKHRTVSSMTFAEVSRLRTRVVRYRIQPIEVLLAECARLGIRAVVEPKGDHRFTENWPWDFIAKTADRVGCHVSMYVLPDNHGPEAVAAAHRAGIPGHILRSKK